ncbi:hypothetical protein AURDEDRAFT_173816 [Auricularia subglabra TFB-10046 SS5]|nr:hypothetical protein AURDEDRAFT_173816 [Auricularia subglabra TFB-10046 SS5]
MRLAEFYEAFSAARSDVKEPQEFTKKKLKARTDAFLADVTDPLNPTCCPYCFNVFVSMVVICPNALSELKKFAHEFWETCVSLLIIYSKSDVPHLRQALAQSQLNCRDRQTWHKHRFPGAPIDSFDFLIDGLCYAVQAAMELGTNPVFCTDRSKQSFHRRNGIWPTNIKSLFSLGVERTVDALLHWCCAPMSPLPLVLLETYLMTARSLVFPLLLDSPRRERFLWALLQAMTPGILIPWPGLLPFALPRGLTVPLSLRGAPAFSLPAMALLDTLYADYGAHKGDAMHIVADYRVVLLSALEQLPIKDGKLGLAVQSARESLLRCLSGHEKVACLGGMGARTEVAYDFLGRLASEHRCAGPGCGDAEISEVAGVRRFKSCELCRVVRYCSRACQRANWTRGRPRHKDVCPLVCSLLQRGAEL